eukprot:710032_1
MYYGFVLIVARSFSVWGVGVNVLRIHNNNKMDETYECRGRFSYDHRVCFYIFKVQARPNHTIVSKNKIRIKFVDPFHVQTNQNEFEADNMEYCGFPLIAWVERNDSFQHIINRYMLTKAIECIDCVHRARQNKRPAHIGKSKWMDSLCDNYYEQGDVIVIKFKKTVCWKDNCTVRVP